MEPNGNPDSAGPIRPLVSPQQLHSPWANELDAALQANDLQRADQLCKGALEDPNLSLTAGFRASVTLASLTSGGDPWDHFNEAQIYATMLFDVAMRSPDPNGPDLEVNIDGVNALFGILKVLQKDLMELDRRKWLENPLMTLMAPQQDETATQPQPMVQVELSAAAAASAEVTANTITTTAAAAPSPNTTNLPPTELNIPLSDRLELFKTLETYKSNRN